MIQPPLKSKSTVVNLAVLAVLLLAPFSMVLLTGVPTAFAAGTVIPTVTPSCTGTTLGGLSQCTVSVTGTSGTPTGSVTFSVQEGDAEFPSGATCALYSGSCAVNIEGTNVGTNVIIANYNGDDTYDVEGVTANFVVGPAATTATDVSCNPMTVMMGFTSVCTATVESFFGSIAGDTVSWIVGTGVFSLSSDTCTITSDSCSITLTAIEEGTFSGVTAKFAGDNNNKPSTSGTIVVWTVQAVTNTVVSCPTSLAVGATSLCTATITGGLDPTGQVTFSYYSGSGWVDITTANPCSLSSGSCSIGVTGDTPGSFVFDALYAGDINNIGQDGYSDTITVTAATTVTSVSCAPKSFGVYEWTTCTAAVSGQSLYPPNGNVYFSQSSGTGSVFFNQLWCTLPGSFPDTCSIGSNVEGLSAGSVTIAATYNLDGGDIFNAVSSGTFGLTVTPTAPSASVTILDCSIPADMLAIGGSGPCSVEVSVASTPPFPTGTVTFSQFGPGSVDFSSSTCSLTSYGECSITIVGTAAGNVEITATYGGDSNYVGSSDVSDPILVGLATSTAVSCTPASSSVGATITCTATISGGSSPTGEVDFSQSSGTGSVGGLSFCDLPATPCYTTMTGNGAGSVIIEAYYYGDSNNAPSTGYSKVLTITPAAGASVYCAATDLATAPATSTTCTATLTGYIGNVAGEEMSWSQSLAGPGVTFSSDTCILSYSGACSVTVTGANAGSDTITATYGGDTNNGESSGSFDITVVLGWLYSDTVTVSCKPTATAVGAYASCLAVVSNGGLHPSGTVTLTQAGSGSFYPAIATCFLPTASLTSSSCWVTLTGGIPGYVIITATYSGDFNNRGTSGSSGLLTVAQALTLTAISSGSASASQTLPTGPMSVKIINSTAKDGTPVTISFTNLGPILPSGTTGLVPIGFYQVRVSGITDGVAKVCITNAGVSSTTVMEYGGPGGWRQAGADPTVPSICGDIPVSALNGGTQIVIGTPIDPASVWMSMIHSMMLRSTTESLHVRVLCSARTIPQ